MSSSISKARRSNLERFLHCTTPTVPLQSLPQKCNGGVNNNQWQWEDDGKETLDYFSLRDLWDSYYEWSAYGVGTKVVLNGTSGEHVTQYYVPYLSAIQLYTHSHKSFGNNNNSSNDHMVVVGGFDIDSWSDESESSNTEDKLSRSLSNNSSKAWDAASSEEDAASSSWPLRDKLGDLYMQYFEFASPYWRIPLFDKITDLAQNFTELMTLRSVDLSPASWMAVAWYPIYHIPTQRNEKDLSTCFLTYHTLSSSFQDTEMECDNKDGASVNCCSEEAETMTKEAKSKGEGKVKISLTPFGLGTYKMHGDLWVKRETSDHERMINLHSAADSWLKQLSISHHDLNFFVSHSTT